jgi:hypothetical protein
MSTNEYTPTTEDVRAAWWWHRGGEGADAGPGTALAEFDRWLAGVVADARREGAIGALVEAESLLIPVLRREDAELVLDRLRARAAVLRGSPVPSRVVVKETGVS